MKKLIAILMAGMFAVGAAYASDAKKDDKKVATLLCLPDKLRCYYAFVALSGS